MTRSAVALAFLVLAFARRGRTQETPPLGPQSAPEPAVAPPAEASPDAPPLTGRSRAAPPPSLPPAPLVKPDANPEPTSGFGANFGVGFALLPTPPDMTLTTPDGGAMTQFAKTPLRHLAGMDMITFSASAFFRTASPITVPLLGFELGVPVSTGYPGSIVLENKPPLSWLKGGPTYYDGLDIGGLGVELASGTFRFRLDVKPGFRYVRTTGTITEGLLTVDAEADQFTFSLRADIQACVGAKGALSACLFGAPHVFEFGNWMNGAVFGLRLETN
jgi:hypothetical protein